MSINEGMWIKVHDAATSKLMAVNLLHVSRVEECCKMSIQNGKRAKIYLDDGTVLTVSEAFTYIGEQIR